MRSQREKLDLSIQEFADKMDGAGARDASTISGIELGDILCPPREVLQSIARVLDVSIETVLRHVDDSCPVKKDGEEKANFENIDCAYKNSILLNMDRNGNGKIKIVPIGDFPFHPDGPHKVTRKDVEDMVSNSKTDIMVDVGHEAIWNPAAEAAGWIPFQSLEVRNDGLYSDYPQFTPDFDEKISQRKYRFLSPAYILQSRDKHGNQIGARLLPISLVNTPYMDEEISHLRNTKRYKEKAMEYTSELKKKLGLSEDATPEQVDARLDEAVKSLLEKDVDPSPGSNEDNHNEPAAAEPALNSEVEARLAELEKRNAQSFEEKCIALVDGAIAIGKLLPADKDVWLNSAKADFNSTKAKLDSRKPNSAMPQSVGVNGVGPKQEKNYANSSITDLMENAAQSFRDKGRVLSA